MFLLDYVTCGGTGIVMDDLIPDLTSLVITVIKIGVPFILIVYGMMDLGKAVMAQKEDEIKKGQQTFIKRLIAAVVVFLVAVIVPMVIGVVAKDDKTNIAGCMNCFIKGSDACVQCPGGTCPKQSEKTE